MFAPGSFTTNFPAWARDEQIRSVAQSFVDAYRSVTMQIAMPLLALGKSPSGRAHLIAHLHGAADSVASVSTTEKLSDEEFERLITDAQTILADRARAGREILKTKVAADHLAATEEALKRGEPIPPVPERGKARAEAEAELREKGMGDKVKAGKAPPLTEDEAAEIVADANQVAGIILSISASYFDHVMEAHRRVRNTEWSAAIANALTASLILTDARGGFDGCGETYEQKVDHLLQITREGALRRDVAGAQALMDMVQVAHEGIEPDDADEAAPDKRHLH